MKKIKSTFILLMIITILFGNQINAKDMVNFTSKSYPKVCDISSARKNSPTNTKSFFWEVSKGNSKVYLLGTFHLTKQNFTLSPQILKAFDESDALGVELNLLDTERVNEVLQSNIVYDENDSLSNHLSEKGIEYLKTVMVSYGVADYSQMEMYTPFGLTSLFFGVTTQYEGYTAEGADIQLLKRAEKANMPILEAEDPFKVYSSFGDLSDKDQEKYYIMTLKSLDEYLIYLDAMYNYYLKGDDKNLFKEIKSNDPSYEKGNEVYYKKMVSDRNIDMTGSIKEYLNEDGKTTFVAVGTAHFLGDDGIIKLLEKDGYKVVRK